MYTFIEFVSAYTLLLRKGREIPLGSYPPIDHVHVNPRAATVVIFSPHPDDECLLGYIALRFRRAGHRVIVVAMTLGSKEEDRPRRLQELEGACTYLGFDLLVFDENTFRQMSAISHAGLDPKAVAIAAFLRDKTPGVVITHHAQDAHPRHQETALAVRNAIHGTSWNGVLLEGEYWSQMTNPNLLCEVSWYDLDCMLKALSFHKGEVGRNPYHLYEPARLIDCVRRCEVVLGKGVEAPTFTFAVMYRHSRCNNGIAIAQKQGRILYNSTCVTNLL